MGPCWARPLNQQARDRVVSDALARLRASQAALEARVARIRVTIRDRDRVILEVHMGSRPGPETKDRLRTLIARRRTFVRMAGQLDGLVLAIEQHTCALENSVAVSESIGALQIGASATRRATRGWTPEKVQRMLDEVQDQEERVLDVTNAMQDCSSVGALDDAALMEELESLVNEEHIAEQFAPELTALTPPSTVPQGPLMVEVVDTSRIAAALHA